MAVKIKASGSTETSHMKGQKTCSFSGFTSISHAIDFKSSTRDGDSLCFTVKHPAYGHWIIICQHCEPPVGVYTLAVPPITVS
jgi:hypothetical protein